jgi:hypothetical protein
MIGLMVYHPTKKGESCTLNFDHLDLDSLMDYKAIWMFEDLALYQQQNDFYRKALDMVEKEMVRRETW